MQLTAVSSIAIGVRAGTEDPSLELDAGKPSPCRWAELADDGEESYPTMYVGGSAPGVWVGSPVPLALISRMRSWLNNIKDSNSSVFSLIHLPSSVILAATATDAWTNKGRLWTESNVGGLTLSYVFAFMIENFH